MLMREKPETRGAVATELVGKTAHLDEDVAVGEADLTVEDLLGVIPGHGVERAL